MPNPNLADSISKSLSNDQSLENWIHVLQTIYHCHRGIPITIGLGPFKEIRHQIEARVLEHRPAEWQKVSRHIPAELHIQLYPIPGKGRLVMDDNIIYPPKPAQGPKPTPTPLPIHLL